jgi:hypothetical protein
MKKPTSIFSLSNFLSYWTNKLRPESQLHKGNEYRNMNYTTYSRMLVLATTDASPPNHDTHPIHPHGILKELEKTSVQQEFVACAGIGLARNFSAIGRVVSERSDYVYGTKDKSKYSNRCRRLFYFCADFYVEKQE